MPDASLYGAVPPGVPPEDYQSFITAQRQQMLANALMQGAFTPIKQPETQPVHGLYVQPRVSPFSAASKIAEALMGRKATDQSMQAEANLWQQLNRTNAPGGQQTSPGTPLQAAPAGSGSNTDASAQGVQPLVQRAPGASLAQTVQATQPTFSPVNPRNPFGAPADVITRLAMSDPAKYAEYLRGTPEWQTALAAYGGNQQAAMQALQAKAVKEGTIAARGGEYLSGPGGTMLAPDVSKGEQYVPDGRGGFTAVPIAGSQDIQASRQAATTAATQANTPHYEPDPFHPGRVRVEYPPTPPALAGAGPAGPPSPVASGTPPAPSPASSPGAAPAAGPAPGGAPAAPQPQAGPTQAPGTRAPSTASDLEQQKAGAKSGQDYADQLLKNATSATEVRRSLYELKNLSTQATPNSLNDAKLELGAYMVASGVSPEKASSFLGVNLDALNAAAKQTGSLAIDSIHDMTNRGTNFDLATFMKYNPNLNMSTPGAFARVTDFMDRKMQQEIGKQADFAQYSRTAPPERWAIDHPASWLAKQNALISQGGTNSRPPLASFDRRNQQSNAPAAQ